MSRSGLPRGVNADTVVWIGPRRGELTDRSAQAQTVTTAGTRAPERVAGYYQDAFRFGRTTDASATGSRLEVAASASLDFSGGFTVDATIRMDNATTQETVMGRVDQTGSQNNAWKIEAWEHRIRLTVWDSLGTSVSVENDHIVGPYPAGRYHNIRCFFDPAGTATMGVMFGGNLTGLKRITIADVESTSLGPLQIGATTPNGSAVEQFTGTIEAIVIRDVADLDPATMAVRAEVDPISRRWDRTVPFDLAEHLEADSWTTDGGAFYIELDDLTLGTFIQSHDDILSVTAKTDGAADTVYTEVGNVTDVQAGTDEWALDETTSPMRLYSCEDPTGFDAFELIARSRISDVGARRLGHYYRPILMSYQAPERRMPYWDEAYPTLGGATWTLAANYADWPSGIADEEATSVIWVDARVSVESTAPGLPWSESIAEFGGLVKVEPEPDGRDRLTVQVVHEAQRAHRVKLQPYILTREEYPELLEEFDGTELPVIWGRELKQVPMYGIETYTDSGNTYTRFKIAHPPDGMPTGDAPITYIEPGSHDYQPVPSQGPGPFGVPIMYDVDLSNGTCSFLGNLLGYNLWANVSGYGTPAALTQSPPFTPVTTFGNIDDADFLPADWCQSWLEVYAGVPTADIDVAGSFTATGGRVQIERRLAEVFDGPAFVPEDQKFRTDTLTFLYVTAERQWKLEDVVKGDAVDWVITDADCLSASFPRGRKEIYKQLRAKATDFYEDPLTFELTVGEAATLDIDSARQKYPATVRDAWPSDDGEFLSRIAFKADLDLALPKFANLLSSPRKYFAGMLSNRFAAIEQMDVLDLSAVTGAPPSPATGRFRVQSVAPGPAGVQITAFSEDPFPATGASAGPVATPFSPILMVESGDEFVTSLTGAASTWLPVENGLSRSVRVGIRAREPSPMRTDGRCERSASAARPTAMLRCASSTKTTATR